MKYVSIFLTIFYFATPRVYAQILNGGFENWTAGKPDDWTVGPFAYERKDTDVYMGKSSFGFNYYQNFPADASVQVITNSTQTHPKGSLTIKGANSITLWYIWYTDTSPLSISTSAGTFYPFTINLKNWSKASVPINPSIDSQVIVLKATCEFDNSLFAFVGLDDIMFDSIVSGVSEQTIFSSSIKIYPNPISSHANLYYQLSGNYLTHASIFDLTGRKVMQLSTVTSASGDGVIPFDCDGLPNGMYYLRFEAGGNILMRKIIVQH
ncbi:MAG: T9SS type A sorting domain-containing protein [Candidatus Kapaibacterium sp.]